MKGIKDTAQYKTDEKGSAQLKEVDNYKINKGIYE